MFMFMLILGVLQADPGTVRDHNQIFRLFCHEAQRVFHDRLINHDDKRYFNTILAEMSHKHFSQVSQYSAYVLVESRRLVKTQKL